MNTYTVTYTPDKTLELSADVKGKSYTDAYVNFTIKHPSNCEIIDIKEKATNA